MRGDSASKRSLMVVEISCGVENIVHDIASDQSVHDESPLEVYGVTTFSNMLLLLRLMLRPMEILRLCRSLMKCNPRAHRLYKRIRDSG